MKFIKVNLLTYLLYKLRFYYFLIIKRKKLINYNQILLKLIKIIKKEYWLILQKKYLLNIAKKYHFSFLNLSKSECRYINNKNIIIL